MRKLLLVWLLVAMASGAAAAQGLSPRAGAVSEGLYTNLYFGMNYKLPADWAVSFVAVDGPCARECLLLDARAPEEKSRRAVIITAEQISPTGGDGRVVLAAASLEQAGAKKLAPARQITLAGRKVSRADYRSTVLAGSVYYTIMAVPANEYEIVFSFSSESRKHLDSMVDDLAKALKFVGGS